MCAVRCLLQLPYGAIGFRSQTDWEQTNNALLRLILFSYDDLRYTQKMLQSKFPDA
jgi:hypothetical protein